MSAEIDVEGRSSTQPRGELGIDLGNGTYGTEDRTARYDMSGEVFERKL
jgi:hypothetical protein